MGEPRSSDRDEEDTGPEEAVEDAKTVDAASAKDVSLRDTLDADTIVEDAPARPPPSEGHEDESESTRPGRLSKTLLALETSQPNSLYKQPLSDEGVDAATADPLIGLVVADRYRILERIGRGGMGIVYRVEHIRIGKLLAMKLLAGELSTNKEIVRRFKLEALTVSKLSCPHTVQVFDYGVWSHLTYLVMELVEGHDLSRELRKIGPLPFSRLGRLMVHVCTSLAEAHDKGITHRDIKPENIMLVTDPRGVEAAKVLDFGLAKLRENAELNEVTLAGAVVGTPYFMSPEQVYGEDVDGRTDIYSLGAVMFKALTGTYPFQAKSPMGMFTKHLTEEPPCAMERSPDLNIPKGVARAIQKCMAKEAKDRFQHVEDVRDMLLDELNILPMSSSERILLDEPSGERLIDSGELKKKRRERFAAAVGLKDLAASQIATREALEGYESKLRRTRYVGWAFGAIFLAGAVGAGAYYYRMGQRFTGSEKEPNNDAAGANLLPIGHAVSGFLGKRLDTGGADLDFYTFELDEGQTHVTLELSAIPNLATCAVLYRVGVEHAIAHYCTGAPAQELVVPNLSIEPGNYYLAVTQDTLGTNDDSRFIFENVSDPYALTIRVTPPEATQEVEPNDTIESHQAVAAGAEMRGQLSWVGDEDVYCVASTFDGAVAWEIRDAKRRAGAVLEATPIVATVPAPIARVHGDTQKPFGKPTLDADVRSPWMSPVYKSDDGQRCLRLRLTSDPWTGDGASPKPGPATYTIRVLHAD